MEFQPQDLHPHRSMPVKRHSQEIAENTAGPTPLVGPRAGHAPDQVRNCLDLVMATFFRMERIIETLMTFILVTMTFLLMYVPSPLILFLLMKILINCLTDMVFRLFRRRSRPAARSAHTPGFRRALWFLPRKPQGPGGPAQKVPFSNTVAYTLATSP